MFSVTTFLNAWNLILIACWKCSIWKRKIKTQTDTRQFLEMRLRFHIVLNLTMLEKSCILFALK